MEMEVIKITDTELNKIIIQDFGKRQFISEVGRVPFLMKHMIKRMLPLPDNISEINSLAERGDYNTMYNLLQKNRMLDNKGKWYYDNVLVLLCYYRLNKLEEAKQLIEGQNYITHSLPMSIMAIASKIGAKYIPSNINKSL